jgi:hypothetical protein
MIYSYFKVQALLVIKKEKVAEQGGVFPTDQKVKLSETPI